MAKRVKAGVLLKFLLSAKTDLQSVVTASEREKLDALSKEFADLNRQIAVAPDAKAAALLEEKLRRARRKRDATESAAIAAHPELRPHRALTPEPLSAASLPGGRTAVLEYAVTDRETFFFVARRGEDQPASEPAVQVPTAACAKDRLLPNVVGGQPGTDGAAS